MQRGTSLRNVGGMAASSRHHHHFQRMATSSRNLIMNNSSSVTVTASNTTTTAPTPKTTENVPTPPTSNNHPSVNPNEAPTSTTTTTPAAEPTTKLILTPQQVEELAQALPTSVSLETRKCKKKGKKYKHVFVGSDCVDILMQLTGVGSREEALDVGRQLQNVMQCVNSSKIHQLEDDRKLFYKFTTTQHLHKNLEDKMRQFQRGVRVKDRTYRLTTYKKCFVGSQAIDLMMAEGMADTRKECVIVGRLLQEKYNLFIPVMGGTYPFEDDSKKFYRLLLPQTKKEQLGKQPSFWDDIQPARLLIVLSLIPAIVIYYYMY